MTPVPTDRAREALPTVTPVAFQILLTLADGERHGYAIMREVADRTDGAVRLGPGTLYGSLQRLRESGLIGEGAERADTELGDERRRYYRITDRGLAVAKAEARRLDSMLRVARAKRLIGPELA